MTITTTHPQRKSARAKGHASSTNSRAVLKFDGKFLSRNEIADVLGVPIGRVAKAWQRVRAEGRRELTLGDFA